MPYDRQAATRTNPSPYRALQDLVEALSLDVRTGYPLRSGSALALEQARTVLQRRQVNKPWQVRRDPA
jgi:hypothetical protein